MSYSTMLLIYPGDKCVTFVEYKNSHGTAPVVWDIFSEKYWKKEKHAWLLTSGDELQEFWSLFNDKTIPSEHRAVFGMTFDRAAIYRKDFSRARNDILKFIDDFKDYPGFFVGVNHWPAVVSDLVKAEFGTGAPAVGIHCTSVSENPFMEFDTETEEYKIRTDIFDLYAELDKLDGGEG